MSNIYLPKRNNTVTQTDGQTPIVPEVSLIYYLNVFSLLVIDVKHSVVTQGHSSQCYISVDFVSRFAAVHMQLLHYITRKLHY